MKRYLFMVTVTVSPKFQVVIPKAVRQKLGIRPGQKLQILQFSDRIEFILLQNIRDMRGFLKGIKTDIRREKDRI
jgi:AbrB family looped-hinge helix DNA binding protein